MRSIDCRLYYRFYVIPIILILLFPNSLFAMNLKDSQKNKYNQLVDSIFNILDMKSLSIVITKNGEIIYEKNLGYKKQPTEKEDGVILEENDLFRIASISKSFVATVVAKLIEEGKISLTDNAEKYLTFPLRNPTYPDIPITIDMLMTHSSTINDSQGYQTLNVINPQRNNNFNKCFLNGPPGRRTKYSNLNYNILGAIIENVTDKRFDQVIDEYIFKPLNITGGYNPLELDSLKFVDIYAYNSLKKSFHLSKNAYTIDTLALKNYNLGETTAIFSPCGGVKISSTDLAKYMNMHLRYGKIDSIRIISKDSEILLRSNPDWIKKDTAHGICYYKNVLPNKTLYGATGGAFGLKSAMLFDPEEKVGFVIISSGSKAKSSNGFSEIHLPLVRTFYNLLKE